MDGNFELSYRRLRCPAGIQSLGAQRAWQIKWLVSSDTRFTYAAELRVDSAIIRLADGRVKYTVSEYGRSAKPYSNPSSVRELHI